MNCYALLNNPSIRLPAFTCYSRDATSNEVATTVVSGDDIRVTKLAMPPSPMDITLPSPHGSMGHGA